MLLEVSSNLIQYSSELCAVIIFSRASGHFSCTINLLVYVSIFVYYSTTSGRMFFLRRFSIRLVRVLGTGIGSGFFKGIRSGSNDKRFVKLNRCGLSVLSSSLSLSLFFSIFLLARGLDPSFSWWWIESRSRVDSARSCVSGWLPAAAAVNQYPHCACHLSFSLPCPASITLYSSLSFSLCFSLALREPSVALRSSRPFSLAVTFTLCLSLSLPLSLAYFPLSSPFHFLPHTFSLSLLFPRALTYFLSFSFDCSLSFFLTFSSLHSLFLPRYRPIFLSNPAIFFYVLFHVVWSAVSSTSLSSLSSINSFVFISHIASSLFSLKQEGSRGSVRQPSRESDVYSMKDGKLSSSRRIGQPWGTQENRGKTHICAKSSPHRSRRASWRLPSAISSRECGSTRCFSLSRLVRGFADLPCKFPSRAS